MWRFAPCKGIRNPGKFCLWNPESGKTLLVKSGIRENFACGIRNPGKVCLWNPESGKSLPSESGIREIFACGIRNLGNFILWNPGSWALEFGSQLKKSGILVTIEIRNLCPTDKDWNQVPGIRNPRAWSPESKTVLDSLAWGVKSAV